MRGDTGKMELISIIITSYNEGEYLWECLDSVRAQTYENIEVLIVDDKSTDQNTISILKQLEKRGERVIWLDHSGVSKARNVAAKIATGKYLIFLDGDDKLASTYVEKMIDVAQYNKDVRMVYTIARLFDGRSYLVPRARPIYKKLLIYNHYFQVTCLLEKERFIKIGGFNEKMIYGIEDWELFLRYCQPGMKVARVNEDLFYYRKKEHSRTIDVNESIRKTLAMRLEMLHNNFDSYTEFPQVLREYSLDIERKRSLKTTLFKIKTVLEMYFYLYLKRGTVSFFEL